MFRFSGFLVIVFFFFSTNIYAKNLWEFLPDPKIETFTNVYIIPASSSLISAPQDFQIHYNNLLQELRGVLKRYDGSIDVPISLKLVQFGYNDLPSMQHNEGYSVIISENSIEIFSPSLRGLVYGLTYLEGLLLKNKGRIPVGEVHNWPDLKIRALHLSGKATVEEIKGWIKEARFAHFNTFLIRLGKPIIRKDKLEEFKKKADKLTLYWFLLLKETLSLRDFEEIVSFAGQNALDVIPQLDLLTHQKTFIADIFPELMLNGLTYDPNKEEVYTKAIFPVLNDLILLVKPKAIHIGHDEVVLNRKVLWRKGMDPWKEILSPDLFLKDVETIYSFLKKKGIETWMWGDMLISPEEFPRMKNAHGSAGYSALRKLLPKDIVICDWHYFDDDHDFPSVKAFIEEGYKKVVGVTWFKQETIRNFSRYMASLPYNNLGMMATTWIGALRHRFRHLNIEVSSIIRVSGSCFWNAR